MPHTCRILSVYCVFATGLFLSACHSYLGERPPESTDKNLANKPNIILIYTDDIDCQSVFGAFPDQSAENILFSNLRRLANQGITFTNFHVTTPVCGPSRASLLSGQYAHHCGIRVNKPGVRSANGFSGGYAQYPKDQELGLWMQKLGYKTAFIGKYLHDGFKPNPERNENWTHVTPSGWDHFVVNLGKPYLDFHQVRRGQASLNKVTGIYRTDSETAEVTSLIEKQFNDDRPTFVCWAPYAAHIAENIPEMTAKRHRNLFNDQIPAGATDHQRFDSIPNQPAEMASIPTYIPDSLSRWTNVHQHRLRSIQALDEGIGKMLDALEKKNQIDKTLILFTSDHGFSMGHHRHFGKRFPYDRITKVPFIAFGAGLPSGKRCDQLIANIDIAPTLIDLADGEIPKKVDGISFAPLLKDPDVDLKQRTGNDGIVIENWDRIWTNGVHVDATYCSLRTEHHIYSEWASGGFEYYDLAADPDQMNNLYPDLPESKRRQLDQALRKQRSIHAYPPLFSSLFLFDPLHEERRVFSANFEPSVFSGFVEDDSGVASVELELYCQKIESWWNGNQWVKEQTRVPAQLAMPGGHVTRWSFSLDTSGIAFDRNTRMSRRDIVVNVLATDMDGNQTDWQQAFDFKMKFNDPESWIDPLDEWKDRSQPLRVTGKAADNFEMQKVTLLIVDLDRNLFWDEQQKQWVAQRTINPVQSNPISSDQPGDWVAWEFDFSGQQSGRLFFAARAFDADGNFDMSIPFRILMPDKHPED